MDWFIRWVLVPIIGAVVSALILCLLPKKPALPSRRRKHFEDIEDEGSALPALPPSTPVDDWNRYDQLVAERIRLEEQQTRLDQEIADLEKRLEGSGPKSVYRLRGKKTG